MLKQIQVQLYPPEQPHWHGDIKKHWRSSGVFNLKIHTFSHYFIVEFGEVLPTALTSRDQGKNYQTCKHRYKLYHNNETGKSTTWKETWIEFKKYADCRFWANIYEISWDFRSVRLISLYDKNHSENHLSGNQW